MFMVFGRFGNEDSSGLGCAASGSRSAGTLVRFEAGAAFTSAAGAVSPASRVVVALPLESVAMVSFSAVSSA